MTCSCAPDLHPGLTHAEHMALVAFDLTLAELERARLLLREDWTRQEIAVLAIRQALERLLTLYPEQASEPFAAAWRERAARLQDWYARVKEQHDVATP